MIHEKNEKRPDRELEPGTFRGKKSAFMARRVVIHLKASDDEKATPGMQNSMRHR